MNNYLAINSQSIQFQNEGCSELIKVAVAGAAGLRADKSER